MDTQRFLPSLTGKRNLIRAVAGYVAIFIIGTLYGHRTTGVPSLTNLAFPSHSDRTHFAKAHGTCSAEDIVHGEWKNQTTLHTWQDVLSEYGYAVSRRRRTKRGAPD